jgi:hypothetical protein
MGLNKYELFYSITALVVGFFSRLTWFYTQHGDL